MNAKLECTTNYDLFEMHEFNRPLHDDPVLLESMKTHGFMPSSPIQCVRNGKGKLRVIRGHHRLHYAKRLKLPVYYVVDETNNDIFDLEGSTTQRWTVKDFAIARSKAGNIDCSKVLEFQKKHGINLGAAASLVGGESAGSGNKTKQIKAGTFKITDMKYANAVVDVTDFCRECGIAFATSSAFVKAVSKVLRIPEFNVNLFLHRIKTNPALIRKCSQSEAYLDEIEAIYNYGAKKNRFPVKYRAIEISRKRQETFGGKNPDK